MNSAAGLGQGIVNASVGAANATANAASSTVNGKLADACSSLRQNSGNIGPALYQDTVGAAGNAFTNIGENIVATAGKDGGGGELCGDLLAAVVSGKICSAPEQSAQATLKQRADEIHGTLSPRTQRGTTTAVADATDADGNQVRLVASSENKLRPAQMAALQPGEIAVSGPGHAEETIMNHAAANGMQVQAVAASRPICVPCQNAMAAGGAVAASPVKAALKTTPTCTSQ